ncbi:hypothetical protein [Hymenobacter coalescens]
MFKDLWPYLVPFVSSILSLLVGVRIANHNRAATETKEQKQAREAAEREQAAKVNALATQVEALQKGFEERKRTADAERTADKLKFEGDLAAVAGILKEFAEAQRLLTGVATNVANHEKRLDRHDTEFDNYREALDLVRTHLNQFMLRRHEP